MNKFRFTLQTLLVALFTLAFASLAQAQATRTWVSGVGDDANPCSRTAPCKTFAGAISKTATGGEINAIDPAGFGTVTLTKSITIDGGGTQSSILSAGATQGILVNAPATSHVVIRNLSINGAGTGSFGIRMLAGGSMSVENVAISGLTNHGIQINLANGTTSNVFIKDCFIRTGETTVSRGINIQPVSGTANVTATIDNVRMERMFVGLYVGEGGKATLRNSVATNMSYAGVVTEAVSGNAQSNIINTALVHNGIGLQAGAGPTITRINNVTIANNNTQGIIGAGNVISFGNNNVFGNATDGGVTQTVPQI
jgi:hypothetical protein